MAVVQLAEVLVIAAAVMVVQAMAQMVPMVHRVEEAEAEALVLQVVLELVVPEGPV